MIFEILKTHNMWYWKLKSNDDKVLAVSNKVYTRKSQCYEEIDLITDAIKMDDHITEINMKEVKSDANRNKGRKPIQKAKGSRSQRGVSSTDSPSKDWPSVSDG